MGFEASEVWWELYYRTINESLLLIYATIESYLLNSQSQHQQLGQIQKMRLGEADVCICLLLRGKLHGPVLY